MIEHVETNCGMMPVGIDNDVMEKIKEAGRKWNFINNRIQCIGGDNFREKVNELNRNPAFEEGAIWALQNIKRLRR